MSAAQWIDLYVVEDEEGVYYEAFSDLSWAEDYVKNCNEGLRKNSPKLVVRHTTADISDY